MACNRFLEGVIAGLPIGSVVGYLLRNRPGAAEVEAKDDVAEIEGIGPKIAGLLAARGIVSLSWPAKTRFGDLQRILEAGGPRFRLAEPSTWADQAVLAAASGLAWLRDLRGELLGGRGV